MTLNIPRRHSHMVQQQEVAGGNRRLEQPRDSAEGGWGRWEGGYGESGGDRWKSVAILHCDWFQGPGPAGVRATLSRVDKEESMRGRGCRGPGSAESEGWRDGGRQGGRDGWMSMGGVSPVREE